MTTYAPVTRTATGKGTIAAQFASDHAKRTGVLNIARECSRLTKPWSLPREGVDPNSPVPENFQSDGARVINNLEGKLLWTLFPPGQPWANLSLAAKIKYAEDVPAEQKQAISHKLFIIEVACQALLESADPTEATNQREVGFHTAARTICGRVLQHGETLVQLSDDYRTKSHRLDKYVTKRNSSTDPLYHILLEDVDTLGLNDETLALLSLKRGDLAELCATDRMKPIHTMIEWHPYSRVWVTSQEIDDKVVNESEDAVPAFWTVGFDLPEGHDYARGWVELNRGDLWSLDELSARGLDYAELASKLLWAKDYGSSIKDSWLSKPNGSMIRARVSGGTIHDLAMLQANKGQDFGIVYQQLVRIQERFAQAGLMASTAAPKGERVTAFAWQTVKDELDGALGGFYVPIADQFQKPLQRRTLYAATRDKLLPKLPAGTVEIRSMTGLTALSQRTQADNISQFAQEVAALGINAQKWLNEAVVVNVLARYRNVNEPGVVRTAQEVAAMEKQAAVAALAQQAGSQAIQTAGNIAETQATQAGKPSNLRLTA